MIPCKQNSTYVDRFVRENYQALREKFSPMSPYIDSRCFSSLDILNETIILLYSEKAIFDDYECFYAFAMAKFTEREKRPKIE
jgi:hypothetical protein